MLNVVKKFISDNDILRQQDKIIVGVSGGADSMCLLHMLMQIRDEYQLELNAVHVNHCLRGEEADRDQELVEQFCRDNKIPYKSYRIEIAMIAKLKGIGEEEAGRIERYRVFEEELIKHNCNKIAVAHHLDDNAETVLYQMFRGSGIQGLTGIRPVRGHIIRPLLCIDRKQIESYMKENEIKYCIDSTNLSGDYSRNVIRNELLPVIDHKINTRAREHIAAAADMLSEIESYLQRQTKQLFDTIVQEEVRHGRQRYKILIDLLGAEDIVLQKRLVKMVLETLSGMKKDLEAVHVNDVLELLYKQVGKQIHLPYGMVISRDYLYLVFAKRHIDNEERAVGTQILWEETDSLLNKSEEIEIELSKGEKKLCLYLCNYNKNAKIPKNECTKWFDYDKIIDTLTVRTPMESDFIQINTTGHSKRIKDYLKDKKIPSEDRKSIPLLASGNHILWIPGYRSSEGFHVDENTKKVLVATLVEL